MASDSRLPDLFASEALPPASARMLLRDITPVGVEDTLRQAIRAFRRQQVTELPVANMGALVGWLREGPVAEAALEEADHAETLTIRAVMEPVPAVVPPEARGNELLAWFQATGNSLLPVISPFGQYLGCVARVDALAARDGWFPPPRIGGMATPLGVYLTTGTVSGGAGALGLMLTGVVFAVMMWVTQHVLHGAATLLARRTGLVFLTDLAKILAQEPVHGSDFYMLSLVLLTICLSFTAFLLLLRYLPRLAGFHAAEHQTVNAIEAGEALTPDAVARMPRVHPRCGTNLWGIIALSYLGVTVIAMLVTMDFVRGNLDLVVMLAVFAIIFVAAAWKHIGGWLQAHLTTRPATARELASGIKAGQELLYRHLDIPMAPRRALRLWRMGFVQVLIGVMLTGYLLQWLDVLWQNLVK